jgi:Spy/CpxP family protein refolding chaperone
LNKIKRNKNMYKLLGVLALSLSATAVAFGAARVSAPELDPASAIAALTLLSGGMAVLRGRRRRGKPD